MESGTGFRLLCNLGRSKFCAWAHGCQALTGALYAPEELPDGPLAQELPAALGYYGKHLLGTVVRPTKEQVEDLSSLRMALKL